MPTPILTLRNKEILIEGTNRCTGDCVICPRETLKRKIQHMDYGLYTKIIDDAAQHGYETLNLCGYGEPFLDSLMFKRIAYAKAKMPNIKSFVSSTCFYMTEDKYLEVKQYIDTLKISFFGLSPDVYASQHRGNIDPQTSLINILKFLQYNEGQVYTVALMVMTPGNEHEYEPWIKFWETRVDEVMVWKPHNWVGMRQYRELDRENQVSCGRPFNGPLVVAVDGRCSPCCFDHNFEMEVGNLNAQSLYQVMHSGIFRDIRNAHKRGDFGELICKDCDQTNHDPSVLVYASNRRRAVGKETATLYDLRRDSTPICRRG